MEIAAIETKYNGYRFRSRLEARWAVFFDALGLRYEYEPEGFDLGEHGRYLPDFYLPDLKLWLEIKPSNFDKFDEGEYSAETDKLTAFGARKGGFPLGEDGRLLTHRTLPNGRLESLREDFYVLIGPPKFGAYKVGHVKQDDPGVYAIFEWDVDDIRVELELDDDVELLEHTETGTYLTEEGQELITSEIIKDYSSDLYCSWEEDRYSDAVATWDGDPVYYLDIDDHGFYAWAECPHCGTVDLDSASSLMCSWCVRGRGAMKWEGARHIREEDDGRPLPQSRALKLAYLTASSARFEFGETYVPTNVYLG